MKVLLYWANDKYRSSKYHIQHSVLVLIGYPPLGLGLSGVLWKCSMGKSNSKY